MPSALESGRATLYPACSVVTPNGDFLQTDGLTHVARWDGFLTTTEPAGMETPSAPSAADSGGGSGPTGTYQYAVRFVDDELIAGPLSSLSGAVTVADNTVSVTSIATSGDGRTSARQLFRNTDGQTTTFYRVTTIADDSTTTYSDTTTDAALLAAAITDPTTILSILAPDGSVNARRQGIPPSHMGCVVHHQDRTFWGVPRKVTAGHAEVTNGSAAVTLVGVVVPAAPTGRAHPWVGRKFTVRGYATEHTISSVSGQVLTLSANFTGTTNLFASYSVHPAKTERRRIYWGYAGEPESVYSEDAVDVESEHSNEASQTGLYVHQSFLFIATPTNTYRWSFSGNPADNTAGIFPTLNRGMVNFRSLCKFENTLAIMDREGIYFTNGGTVNPASDVIQDIFNSGIVWGRQEWFHAAALPAEETARFFVCLEGTRYPKHALCCNFRTMQWWVEEYAYEIGDSLVMPFAGKQTLLLGGEHEKILVYGDTPTDGLPLGATLPGRHDVSSATFISVTVSSPAWSVDSDIKDSTVAIVTGRGKGQVRRIIDSTKSTGRIDIKVPWDIVPDETSKVVVGAIAWLWQSDHLDMLPSIKERKQVTATVQPTEYDSQFAVRLFQNKKPDAIRATGRVGPQDTGVYMDEDSEYAETNIRRYQDLQGVEDAEHDGVVRVSMGEGRDAHVTGSFTFVQVELSGATEKEPVTIESLDIVGAT